MLKSLADKIEFFFRDPYGKTENEGEFSNLFLLRKNLLICDGYNLENRIRENPSSIWAVAVLTFIGIDILSKYYSGEYSNEKNKVRFTNFVHEMFGVAESEANIIYSARCSVLHEFGWENSKMRFIFTHESADLIKTHPINSDCYYFDFTVLYIKFEESINRFKKLIEEDELTRNRFFHIFDSKGVTQIQTSDIYFPQFSSTGTPFTINYSQSVEIVEDKSPTRDKFGKPPKKVFNKQKDEIYKIKTKKHLR